MINKWKSKIFLLRFSFKLRDIYITYVHKIKYSYYE